MKVSYAGEYVPEIHFLHLEVRTDDDPQSWWRLRVCNQLFLDQLPAILSIASPTPSPSRWLFVIGDRTFGPDARRRTRLASVLAPSSTALYLNGRAYTIVVAGWSAILPDDRRVLYLDGAASFDPAAANAALDAHLERPARSDLH